MSEIRKKRVTGDSDTEIRITRLKAVVERLVKRAEKHWGVDIDGDGKKGRVSVGLLAILALAVGIGIVVAATTQFQTYDGDATHGTFKVVDDGAGTATLTVDAVSADLSSAAQTSASAIEVDATDETPAFIGQSLIFTVSNYVFIAEGTTSNDWIQVAP